MNVNRRKILLGGCVLLVLVALIVSKPPPVGDPQPAPSLQLDSVDSWLAEHEKTSPYPLIEGTEKRIRWQENGVRTEWAIVYLHGFSATRQEIAPTMDLVADAIGANLYETRLYGHGRADGALESVQAEQWMDDGVEALAVGSVIGEKLILVGTSTGATLAAALSDHALMATVADIVFISPNFAVRDERSEILTLPGGPWLAERMIGKTRTFPTSSEDHATYWSSSYPTRALVEAMRLVKHARSKLPLELDARLLLIVAPDDKVISTEAALSAFESSRMIDKQLINIERSDDPMNHVLSGRILSPSNTERVAAMITKFLQAEAVPMEDATLE